MGVVELGEEGWVQDVVPRDPRAFFGTISLPVYQILQEAAPPTGIQDVLHTVN